MSKNPGRFAETKVLRGGRLVKFKGRVASMAPWVGVVIVMGMGSPVLAQGFADGGGTATGNNSVAIGNAASSPGIAAVAVGDSAAANENQAIAVGQNAEAQEAGIAIGDQADAADFGVSIGQGSVAGVDGTSIVGTAVGTNRGLS